MDAHLHHEVLLHPTRRLSVAGPVGVLVVDGSAFALPPCHHREPVLMTEEIVGPCGDAHVEQKVEAQLFEGLESVLALVVGLFLLAQRPAHHSVTGLQVSILDHLHRGMITNLPTNPTRHHIRDGSAKT